MVRNLIISRIDSIGDVVLTLPAAGWVKKNYPEVKIFFIGRTYTKPIIDVCSNIDEFINWDDLEKLEPAKQVEFMKSLRADALVHVYPNSKIARLAQKSRIPIRVGTSHRFFHWFYCNKRIPLGRKRSNLHESQLNLKLFRFLGANKVLSLDDIPELYGLTRFEPVEGKSELIDTHRFNLILHPKSKGSAREWGLENFGKLIDILPKDKFKIFITGTADDRKLLTPLLEKYGNQLVDLTGKMSLPEFIRFIRVADGIVAASTGPLHIAAALGKVAIGLYAPMRPIHPGRWSPLGMYADFLVLEKKCVKCRRNNLCECIRDIKPEDVKKKIVKYNVRG